jgi:UDP-N-acetylmuramyl pentapeptide synthase
MLELGEASAASHREVGGAIAQRAPGATLLTVGPESRLIAAVARAEGVTVHEAADAAAASDLLVSLLADGHPSTVLAKGSRGIGLDHVVARVLAL